MAFCPRVRLYFLWPPHSFPVGIKILSPTQHFSVEPQHVYSCRDPAGPMHHLLLQSLSLHTTGISSSLRGIPLQCWPVMAEAEFHCSQSLCPWLLMLRLTMCAINGSPLCRVSGSGFSSLLATIAQVTCSESLRQQALILGHANSCLTITIFMSHAPCGLLFVETEKRAGNSVDKILLFLLPRSGA